MPYVLKEKQRKYQREWAAKKAARLQNQALEGIDGISRLQTLRKNVVTWEELQDYEKVKDIKNWDEAILASRNYVVGRKINRIAIACLALRACKIVWGGNKQITDENEKDTLKKFAQELNIHYKTLHDWVTVKRKIIDHLPPNVKFLDYTAAHYAIERRFAADPIKAYFELSDFSKPARSGHQVLRYLNCAASHFHRFGLQHLSDKEIELVRGFAKFVLSITENR